MKFIKQNDQMDCGPACLAMISNFYGKSHSLVYLRDNSYITREGVSLQGISETAQLIGFDVFSCKSDLESLISNSQYFPVILHWNQNHFVVLKRIKKSLFKKKIIFEVADPAHGKIKLTEEKFKENWLSSDSGSGIVLFLSPNDSFYDKIIPKVKNDYKYVFTYLVPYKSKFFLTFILILVGSVINLAFPFLTETLIDDGVNAKNLNIISIVLIAQLSLFLGLITINIFRNWITLYVGSHLSIGIISDFLNKILKLPLKFFDTKLIGDFQQRIKDNDRVEEFLTSQSLLTLFSIITFTVFFGVLWIYDFKILMAYLSLTVVSLMWSFYWLSKKKKLDYVRFQYRSDNQESIIEMLNGISEMKLNQFENFKIKEWEVIQKKLFETNKKILKLDQIQLSGFDFFNQFKNIIVTFLAATYVVKGNMSIGELMSVSYITGQMNSPLSQLVNFFKTFQEAKYSLDRLNEVKNQEPEESDRLSLINANNKSSIVFKKLSFQYEGPKSKYILKNINLVIPEGKITALVGASGSGKTTLMKLLLKFYDPTSGEILFNSQDIKNISPKSLRENCGVVMQDGFIFSDTIERNIATGDEVIDKEKLKNAVKVANLEEFINSLPLGFNTKIGASGNGISGGQRQRILIARAIYKNPQYVFFDEATSALDAENEKIIHDNLQQFFKGKTVLIIAHRLSTVKNADQIIVLKNGKVTEIGNHQQLVQDKADYFNLVRNQLELGN